ncbi:MAG: chorismate-binding protein [Verrucomicrobiia bacterium]
MTNPLLTMADVLAFCVRKGLTFAAYRLPFGGQITAVIQSTHALQRLSSLRGVAKTKAFVFAPFQATASIRPVIIAPDVLIRDAVTEAQADALHGIVAPPLALPRAENAATTEAVAFQEQVERCVSEMRRGDYQKVVLSRTKSLKGNFAPAMDEIFFSLCEAYPEAFVYLVNMEGQHWMGATPEPLLCSDGDLFYTDSLAATRSFTPGSGSIEDWNAKERQEQRYVAEDIEAVLQRFGIRDYTKVGPLPRRAGSLLHLCTRFSFPKPTEFDWGAFVDALHPTPAICGTPRARALQVIKALERHDRAYYGGFLGPVGLDGHLQLFVNLRCMKLYQNAITVFAGSGITSDSIPKEEWQETELKCETVLSVVTQSLHAPSH